MRLVTRSDFDGLVCAVLLKQVEPIDEIKFVHPKDLQDGTFVATSNDILTNVPYVPGCGLWFDHHSSEVERVVDNFDFRGECRLELSAARVVYDYYGGRDRFKGIGEMMEAVDRADSAQFTSNQILHPEGWDLLSFVMDARTGLGRYQDYRISNYQLMFELIDACTHMSIEEILQMEDVRQRVKRYFEHEPIFRHIVTTNSVIHGNVIVTDMREVVPIPCGNRFMIYALYPGQNVSIWIVNGFRGQNCVFACGHSIVNRSCQTNVGALMARFGGGGHHVAGTCQVAHKDSMSTLMAIVETMRNDERPLALAA